MFNSKKIILVITVFALLGLIFIIYFYRKNNTSDSITNQPKTTINQFPIIPGEKPSVSSNTFDIKTQEGEISVKNIYALPDTKPLSDDGINFENNQYYYMAYYPKQQGFLISILNPDIEKARTLAEQYFLDVLNTSKSDACKLNVSLTVSPNANKKASGGNYRLSFCPNGKPFP